MSGDVRIVLAVSLATEFSRQFALAAGEILVLGRSPGCDVVVDFRGVSARHAELYVEHSRSEGGEQTSTVFVRDVSTNGTGAVDKKGEPWEHVRNGESRALAWRSQVLVPYNRRTKDTAAVLSVRIEGEALPDAYDERCGGTGRWLYHGKLGEGALGIVHRAADATGVLKGIEVAIKVAKMSKVVKASSRARSAYILHREAQWSLQRVHNRKGQHYDEKRASIFMRYLEDHTGTWIIPSLSFDDERSVFEAPDFSWDKFVPQPPLPPHPYVVVEFVPGRTLHSSMGWGHEQGLSPPLQAEEKMIIAEQAAEALDYLSALQLVHRDFRTTNLMVSGRNAQCSVRAIDLGHMVAAEEQSMRNRSAVVKCNWKETQARRFDWAPPEVKDKAVNFELPAYAFDVFSFALLLLQLECADLKMARAVMQRLCGSEGSGLGSTLGLDDDFLRSMLGDADQRPSPHDVLEYLQLQRLYLEGSARDLRERSRSRDRKARWQLPGDVEMVAGNGEPSAAYFGSDCSDPMGSDTEPE